jgi:nucleoside-diphosphate-sugar epimerase
LASEKVHFDSQLSASKNLIIKTLQTILGAGGAIGIPLARELKKFDTTIRLASRNPQKVNADDELYVLDATDAQSIDYAVEGSSVVYVTIGFEYRLSVWQKMWPVFMKNVIDACKKHKAKLVFFDNVYMYSADEISFMTEAARIAPPSQKGKVRAKLHEMLTAEFQNPDLDVLIARSADFYGPTLKNSLLSELVVKNFQKKKSAQAFGNLNKIHTYTYTPDAAMATALLGNTPDAYNQVWHVPTTKEKISNKGWVELIAAEMGVKPRVRPIPLWMLKLLGIFIPVMGEFPEMSYQYEQDYIFDSTKFEKRFGIKATPAAEGVKQMLAEFAKK